MEPSPRLAFLTMVLVITAAAAAPSAESGRSVNANASPTTIDSCTTITEPGRYELGSDVRNAGKRSIKRLGRLETVLNPHTGAVK